MTTAIALVGTIGDMTKAMQRKYAPDVVRQRAIVLGGQAHQRRLKRFADANDWKLSGEFFGHESALALKIKDADAHGLTPT